MKTPAEEATYFLVRRPKCTPNWWGDRDSYHYVGCPVCGEYVAFFADQGAEYWQNRPSTAWDWETGDPPCMDEHLSDGESAEYEDRRLGIAERPPSSPASQSPKPRPK